MNVDNASSLENQFTSDASVAKQIYASLGLSVDTSLETIEANKPIKIFYCYARKDKRFRDMLEKYLSAMKRSQWVSSWHDSMIEAGEDWERRIDEEIKAANIILLLVSPDFMNSDYCYGVEMKRALERHEAKEARVIPLILRPTDWEDAPFSRLQVLPSNGRPLTRWSDRDEAFLDIAKGIRKSVRQLLSSQKTHKQWMEEGVRFFQLRRYEEADAAFDQVISQAPYNLFAYMQKGAALYHLKRYEEALKVYEKGIDLVPVGSLSYIGKVAIAMITLLYEGKGDVLLLLNRFEESLIEYNNAIHVAEEAGGYSGGYYKKGLVFMKLDHYEEAVLAFEEAITSNPDDQYIFVYYTDKGNALSLLERTEDSLRACEQALALNPDYDRALQIKSVCLGKLGKYEEALVSIEQAIRLDPNSSSAYRHKADCLYELQDYEAALVAYQKVIHLDANDYHSLSGIGNALSKLGRDREALSAFEVAIRVNPHNTYAHKRLADIYQDLGQTLESQVILKLMNTESANEEIDSYPTDNAEELLAFCEQKLLDNPHNSIALILKTFALFSVKGSKEAYNFFMLLSQNDPDIERGVWGPYFYALRAVLEYSLEKIVEAPQSREDQLSEEFENKQNPIDIMKEDDLSGGRDPVNISEI